MGKLHFKYKVWKKYGGKCAKCEKKLDKFTYSNHHIFNKQTKELTDDPENGILFCKDCHKEFHKIYGFKNNNLIQVKEFLKIN